MSFVQGKDREEITLRPMCIDDMIAKDNECRVIDSFCENIDVVEYEFKNSQPAETGRPPYRPNDLLKLCLYGYLNSIKSSGKLQKETTRNIEVMWLLNSLTPKKRTICYFFSENKEAIKKVFRKFNEIYREAGLFSGELLAVDSVKIRADNSRKNNHNAKTIEMTLEKTEKRIDEYIETLEEADKNEAYDEERNLTSDQIEKIIDNLKAKKAKFEDLKIKLEDSGQKEISTVDSDSRLMRQGSGKGLDVSYNTQVAADSKNKMIVEYETTNNSNDYGNLFELTEKAKATLNVEETTVIADTGYYEAEEIINCEENGTTCIIPKKEASHQAKDSKYYRENFKYDAENDEYICPEGIKLKRMRIQKYSNNKKSIVYANYSACTKCPFKDKCTGLPRGREILRQETQDRMDEIDKRYKRSKGIYKKRQEIIEHVFGTIKWVWNFNRYQRRGLENVDAENSMLFCAYNLRRALNVMGVLPLLDAIEAHFKREREEKSTNFSAFFIYLKNLTLKSA